MKYDPTKIHGGRTSWAWLNGDNARWAEAKRKTTEDLKKQLEKLPPDVLEKYVSSSKRVGEIVGRAGANEEPTL